MDEGLQGATDAALFEQCRHERRVLVTLDLQFANPLRFKPEDGAGIAVLRAPESPGRRDLRAVLERLLQGLQQADITGRLGLCVRTGSASTSRDRPAFCPSAPFEVAVACWVPRRTHS